MKTEVWRGRTYYGNEIVVMRGGLGFTGRERYSLLEEGPRIGDLLSGWYERGCYEDARSAIEEGKRIEVPQCELFAA